MKHIPELKKWKIPGIFILIGAVLLGCVTDTPSSYDPAEPEEPEVSYAVGDTGPAGGIIFYVDSSGDFDWTYLEAAPADWHSSNEDPESDWGTVGTLSGASGRDVGMGLENTRKILEADPEGALAVLISTLEISGFSDWFIPSQGELNLMYNQLFRRGLGELARSNYWSSTESNDERAFSQNFATAGPIASMKSREVLVRPIRAF